MENEMQKAVTKITDEKKHLMTKTQEEPIRIGRNGIKEISRVCNTRSEEG